METKRKDNRFFLGLILLLGGLLLLISGLPFVPDAISELVFYWPTLLMAVGIILILTDRNRSLGTILLVVGGVFFLPRFLYYGFNIEFYEIWGFTRDIFEYRLRRIIFSWQMILIVIGLILLSNKENKTPGIVLLTIGGVFLMPRILDIPYEFHKFFWPVLLISIGAIMLLRRNSQQTHHRHSFQNPEDKYSTDYIDDLSIFGGGDKIITSQNFKGGKITAIFGGSEVNLLNCELSAETDPMIDVFAMFGGTNIIIPEDWNLKIDVTPIFGGFADKRMVAGNTHSGKTLYIKGVVLFGGGEIKSFPSRKIHQNKTQS